MVVISVINLAAQLTSCVMKQAKNCIDCA